jgi:hypothetical protein
MEEQLNVREKALCAREKRLQSTERPSSSSSTLSSHRVGGSAAVRRANSLPVFEIPIDESEEEEGEDNRRMSLQQEDPIPAEPDQRNTGWVGNGPPVAPPPFRIYTDESLGSATATAGKKEDFTLGVARARELLNRPRLMTIEGQRQRTNNSEYYPSGATGSTFYKNYLANKKANDCATAAGHGHGGIENMKPAMVIPAPLPSDGQRRGNQILSAADNGGCGSATKRPRCDYEVTDNAETVPSVQVDLHSLMAAAGRGR